MPESRESTAFLVVDIARLIRRDFERAVAAEGLSVSAGEARTLLYLTRLPRARQSLLAEYMRVEPMTLSGYLDKLERRGLVERLPDPDDRRAKHVALTGRAAPLSERLRAIAAEVRGRATRGMNEGETEALRRALGLMRANLGEAPAEAGIEASA